MKRTTEEEFDIFLSIAKIKYKYNLTREEFEKDLDHIFKPMTDKEKILLSNCYESLKFNTNQGGRFERK